MKTKTITWAEHQKLLADKIRNSVLKLTGMSEQQYTDMVFNYGHEWINSRVDGDAMGIEVLSCSTHFWDWFCNQWRLADEVWVALHMTGDAVLDNIIINGWESVSTIAEADKRPFVFEYAQLHHIDNMTTYPNNDVWDDVTKIINEKIAAEVNAIKEIRKEAKVC
jgi:hypothetical protein